MNNTIILLNGPTSSGKSTISKAFQAKIDKPFVHLSFDTYLELLPERFLEAEGIFLSNKPLSEIPTHPPANGLYSKLVEGFHRTLAAMASTGLDIIIDHAIKNEAWFLECYTQLHAYKLHFVGLHCAADILEAREIERGDRPIGLSHAHNNAVHTNMVYDIEINSGELSADKCATALIDFLEQAPIANGFEQSYQRINRQRRTTPLTYPTE
jgi:chloramphenicol 3-O phosphotransferase